MDGDLYGITSNGGTGSQCPSEEGCGTIFRITSTGILSTLYSFCAQVNCTDGSFPFPFGPLVQDADGNFYGETSEGGSTQCQGGCGTVFKITPVGALTVIYEFDPANTGPTGLVQAADGNFYGATYYGGEYGYGAVFRMTPQGVLTTLYDFCAEGSPCLDGANAWGAMIQATDGRLYGGTVQGGAGEQGTIFAVTTEGGLATVHSFDGSDGIGSAGQLMQSTDGMIYGTTAFGGDISCTTQYFINGCGTTFSVDMGLGPFVTFALPFGKVGQTGGILGQGFTGTTSVSFNGILASFIAVSDTFIRATVPAGATSGFVTVTTPSGTLTSNVPFHVLP
jgi:uncharacterized repeat protein (TIGR03803 family)